MAKTVKVNSLYPGQVVGLPNCVQLGTVIKRLENGVYLVAWGGYELRMIRSQLSVKQGSRFVFGPHNEIK